MRTLVFSLLGSILLLGCTMEKRLGESRIEARRYSRGYHVQHHRSQHKHSPVEDEGHRSRLERPVVMPTEAQAMQSLSESLVVAVTEHHPDTPVQPVVTRSRVVVPSAMQAMAHRAQIEVPKMKQPVLLETEALPEPVDGYHPNAVPGFILSMGWALGIIGELAVEYLKMPLSGVAIVFGILASIAGYVLSRKAYRASLAHPELYPRYRLPRAARFVSIGFLAPIVLYVGLVLLILLFVGGFGLL